jgi:hypothetical protein
MADKYIIIDLVDVTEAMVGECLETSLSTLRKNIAEDEVLLKWNGDTPATILALDPQPTQYTYAEIIAFLNDSENGWVE